MQLDLANILVCCNDHFVQSGWRKRQAFLVCHWHHCSLHTSISRWTTIIHFSHFSSSTCSGQEPSGKMAQVRYALPVTQPRVSNYLKKCKERATTRKHHRPASSFLHPPLGSSVKGSCSPHASSPMSVQHNIHTQPFYGPLGTCPGPSGWAGLDLLERDIEWQWHQWQICTLYQTHNHASIPALSLLQAGRPSCHPTNSVKAPKAAQYRK